MSKSTCLLPHFNEAEQATIDEQMTSATREMNEVMGRFHTAASAALLVSLRELFDENPCLRRVTFESVNAYDDNDWYMAIDAGCEVEDDIDEMLCAEIEERWEEIAGEWTVGDLEEMLPEGGITRERLAARLTELKDTLAAAVSNDG
jgi:hypothetical protein